MTLADPHATAPVPALAVTHVTVAPLHAALALPAGTRIGKYEVIRVLGHGGMGQVYLARDVVLGRRVAVKFMLDNRPHFVERFLLEARATARCQHENIVVIHELGDYHGHGFLVLEYLEGESLASVAAGGRLPAGRAIELLLPVARALVHAHEQGLVHRDLKPENVLVTSEGTVKVLDFGIAAAFDTASDASPAGFGRASAIAGTPLYMAPEQHLGVRVDQRADQWAFGILLHELVVGAHPLGPSPSATAVQAVADLELPMPTAARAAGAPPAVVAVIERCLTKDPTARFASTRALLEALEAALPTRAARPDRSPFPGLASFTAADADVYFGRTSDVRRALARLREHPLVAVVGPSGVGKSSFVRAGLAHALADAEAWEVLTLRPGRDPLAALAALIGDPGPQTIERLRAEPGHLAAELRSRAASDRRHRLVFIDQFEELFTQDTAIEDRAAFVACVEAVADDVAAPLRVVVAMRSDFLDRVAEHGSLMTHMAQALLFLSPLDRNGLRQALTQPVRLAGYHFESDAVVDDVLDAIEHTPAALPLLQFVAERMWEARDRDGRRLTALAYRDMGGVVGAIAAHADRAIGELGPARERAARGLFLRLVTAERTRAIVPLHELTEAADDGAAMAALIDALVAARLLVISGDGGARTVEVIHDALITGWPRLAAWLGEELEVVAFLDELRAAAARWDGRGRPESALWRGDDLANARRLRARLHGRDRLAERERQFLDAAVATAARKTRQRRWIWATVVAVLAVIAAGALVALLWIQRAEGTARAQAERARDRAREALRAREEAQAQAERARAAETARGAEVDLRQAAEARATTAAGEVERKDADLAAANARLQAALDEQARAAARANTARAAAEAETARAQRAEQAERAKQHELERVLAEREERVRRLEQQLKKITTELK